MDQQAENRKARRWLSISFGTAAAIWGAFVVWQVLLFEGDGPPIGAIMMALPSFALLIAAATTWPEST